MARTTTQTQKPQQRQQMPQQEPDTSRQQVAIAAPRLPYHPAIQERFGVDKAGWKVLCESIFPSAKTTEAIILALSYCKARRLDPYKRNIHIVPIYDSKKRAEVETVWPGIAELRTTAMRTKSYAGIERVEFGPMITRSFKDNEKNGDSYKDIVIEVTFPEWCLITVRRVVQGQVVTFPGPKVVWTEFYNKKSRYVEAPNEQWRRRPSQMLEKCAEAGALRRAFPEEFGEEYTVEEIGAFGSLATSAKAVDAEVITTTSPIEPRRSDFNGKTQAQEQEPDDQGGDPRGSFDEQRDAATGDSGDPDADPATGEIQNSEQDQQPAANPWFPEVVGQDAITGAIVALITEKAQTAADLDAIEAANKERVAKFTQANRAKITNAMDDRREDLGSK